MIFFIFLFLRTRLNTTKVAVRVLTVCAFELFPLVFVILHCNLSDVPQTLVS